MKYDRNVNSSTDLLPTQHHIFEAKFLKKYSYNKSVLDIGCWSGQFLSLLTNAKKITGVDVSKRAINYSKKNRTGRYLVATALKLPFRNSHFDLVTMLDVIEHLPKNSEKKAISEVLRVLKKGGFFAISTVTTHPLSILMDPAFFFFGHRHYSKEKLVNLLKNNGFKIQKIVYTGGIWSLLGHNFALLQKHLRIKNIHTPFQNLAIRELNNGFDHIHIIAQKC